MLKIEFCFKDALFELLTHYTWQETEVMMIKPAILRKGTFFYISCQRGGLIPVFKRLFASSFSDADQS